MLHANVTLLRGLHVSFCGILIVDFLQYQEIIVAKIPPGGAGSIAIQRSDRAKESKVSFPSILYIFGWWILLKLTLWS